MISYKKVISFVPYAKIIFCMKTVNPENMVKQVIHVKLDFTT